MITEKIQKSCQEFIIYFHLHSKLYGLWLWILIMLFSFEY